MPTVPANTVSAEAARLFTVHAEIRAKRDTVGIPMNILVLNAGSSSLKFQVIATDLERIEQRKDERLCRYSIRGYCGHSPRPSCRGGLCSG